MSTTASSHCHQRRRRSGSSRYKAPTRALQDVGSCESTWSGETYRLSWHAIVEQITVGQRDKGRPCLGSSPSLARVIERDTDALKAAPGTLRKTPLHGELNHWLVHLGEFVTALSRRAASTHPTPFAQPGPQKPSCCRDACPQPPPCKRVYVRFCRAARKGQITLQTVGNWMNLTAHPKE